MSNSSLRAETQSSSPLSAPRLLNRVVTNFQFWDSWTSNYFQNRQNPKLRDSDLAYYTDIISGLVTYRWFLKQVKDPQSHILRTGVQHSAAVDWHSPQVPISRPALIYSGRRRRLSARCNSEQHSRPRFIAFWVLFKNGGPSGFKRLSLL